MRPMGRPFPTASSTSSRSRSPSGRGLVGQAALAQPRRRAGRAGADGVAADAVLRVRVGHEPREREDGGLRHGVVRHADRRPLPRRRGHVHDGGVVGLPQVRQRRADRADVAHHVGVPGAPASRRRSPRTSVAIRATPRLFTSTSRPPRARARPRRPPRPGRPSVGEVGGDGERRRSRPRPRPGRATAIATRGAARRRRGARWRGRCRRCRRSRARGSRRGAWSM